MSALLDQTPAEHGLYARTGIAGRPPLAWPGGARLALAIVVSVETYEMAPPEGSFQPANLPGGFGRGPWPDLRSWSQREYGSRVGVFRLLELLARHGLPVTPAVDRLSVERCPEIVDALQPWRQAVVAHGEAVTRVVSHRMPPAEEAAMIEGCAVTLAAAFGQRPVAWHGAEYGASAQTPALLAAAGFQQLLDWPNDEQPYRMQTPAGDLLSVPVAIDHDDVYAQSQRGLTPARWAAAVLGAVQRMAAEGGRSLVLNLHPWLSGQPHRISHLDALLRALKQQGGIWFADVAGIAAHCREGSAP
jgi:peptidoglycan/xylan/chitin deacetylase (PgdA/CDA1 family)